LNSLCLTTRVCAAALFCALSAYGQAVNGTLLGTITDSTGAVVRGAQITATESNTGVSRVTKTASSGNYVFSDLAPGTYVVAVENAGFKKAQRTDVDVLVNTTVRVDITLEIGNVAETVSVTAEVAALQTDRSDTGRKIESVQTANLPLGTNRNFQSLLNLVPGTTRATFQHSQFFNAASSLQTEVNGQMRQGNNYQIEGIDDNERTGLLQIIVPPIEAIETVDVSTSNFEAELGRASGAVTNVMLKSGTNGFHGAGYEFLKNSDLNARGFFDPSVGHLAYNYFGGNIGGPIIRNKIFFFGDYLRIKDHEANTNNVTIPTMPFRTGDLSAAPTAIYNPFSGNADGTGRTPFPGNQIPANLINPVSAKILALLPAPNRPNSGASFTNDYFALLPFTKDTDSADLKIDANLTDKDRLNGRFSWARPITFQAPIFGAAGGPAQSAFEGTGTQKSYSAGINYVRVFSSTLISEFRFGAAHYHNEAQNSDYGTTASTAIGVLGVNVSQFTSGLVGVVINGGFNGTNPLVLTCCRRRRSAHAACTLSAKRRPRFPAPRPDSVMTWQASCSMFRVRPAAIWRFTSRPIAPGNSSCSLRANGR
jgi:hypothetical protein